MPPKRDSRETITKSKGRQKRKLCGRLEPLLQSKKRGRKGEVKVKQQRDCLKKAKIKKPVRKLRAQV
jgi:23S rRNA A1618 N6-methylase RlmF